MTLKRGLSIAVIAVMLGLVSCTTTAPFISSFTGLPGTILPLQTATLTITGSPGSSAGLWTYSFSVSPSGCGTVTPSTIGPTNQTTVTATFTASATPGPCTVTVTLTTASGKKATFSQTTTIGALPTLPACAYPEHHDTDGVPSGGVENYPIAGASGDRAFAYVQLYAINDDTILRLGATSFSGASNCPGGAVECDDDDGATYTSIGTNPYATDAGEVYIAYGFNSIIAGHPLPAATSFVAVNGYFSSPVDPYRLYRHVVPAGNLVIPPSDPGNTPTTAFLVPGSPTPWIIGEAITAGDADWYQFNVTSAPVAIFVAVDLTPDSPSGTHDELSAWDAALELRDSTGLLIINAASPGVFDGSVTIGSPSPPAEGFAIRINTPGLYFIVVRHYSATGTGPGYHLTACQMTTTVLPAVEKPGDYKDLEEILKDRIESMKDRKPKEYDDKR